MSDTSKIKWTRTGDQDYSVPAHRGYSATITYTAGTGYVLLVSPGGYTSTWPTLRNAKNDFRKFLTDK